MVRRKLRAEISRTFENHGERTRWTRMTTLKRLTTWFIAWESRTDLRINLINIEN